MASFAPAAIMTALEFMQNNQKQKAQQSAMSADAEMRVRQIRQSREIETRRRRERLKETMAAQRARFGAQGIGKGGSAQALLQGLVSRTDNEESDAIESGNMRIRRINEGLLRKRRLNLLEESQARTRMVFGRISKGLRKTPLLRI